MFPIFYIFAALLRKNGVLLFIAQVAKLVDAPA